MCGIIGYTGQRPAGPILIEGLRRLEYRGYDSAGIALFDDRDGLFVQRAAGKVDQLVSRLEGTLPPASAGIGHTRWATHGGATDANAHPHLDPSGRVAVVHNGIIENFESLQRPYRQRGIRFMSETDTEVLAYLVADELARGLDLAEAVRAVIGMSEGAYSLVVITKDEPGRIVAARVGNAGGIVLGHNEDEKFIASDLAALLPHTRNVTFLEPGEVADITAEAVRYTDLEGMPLMKAIEVQSYDPVAAVKGRFKHFMLKEIHEQPVGTLDMIRGRYRLDPPSVDLDDMPFSAEQVRAFTRVVLIGMGTSMHSAMVGRHYIERFARIPAEVDNAAEFTYRRPVLDEHTLVISVSQSGETVDLLAAMEEARAAGCPQLTVCNVPGAQTTRVADATIYMRMGPEIAVASTKTMMASIIAIHAVALWLGRMRGTLDSSLEREQVEAAQHLPAAIGEALLLEPQIAQVARKYAQAEHFLFLGRGWAYPIAMEGALKLKEVSYIHAEGYPAGEMKHGPIALIDEHMPTVALALRDELHDKMRSNIEQLKARRGPVVAVVSQGDETLNGVADDVIELPEIEAALSPLVALVVMQLLAYYIALERGADIDQPRNLAKTVTVE